MDAALRYYALHGYQGATMRKIAEKAGIKPASIYFFYKNKENLFIDAFQQLLDDHFQAMQRAVYENKDQPIEQIFSAMIHGSVQHHLHDKERTKAYISLVTAPIPEITQHLQDHMSSYQDWLIATIGELLETNYPLMPETETDRVIKQVVLIGNGVFWGINLYEGDDLTQQVELADHLIHNMVQELKTNYQNT